MSDRVGAHPQLDLSSRRLAHPNRWRIRSLYMPECPAATTAAAQPAAADRVYLIRAQDRAPSSVENCFCRSAKTHAVCPFSLTHHFHIAETSDDSRNGHVIARNRAPPRPDRCVRSL